RRRHGRARRGVAPPDRRGRAQPHQPAAHAGGTVPPALPADPGGGGKALGAVAMNTFTGTGKLVRLILRRDRLLMPLWILFIGVVPISVASSFAALYPTAAAREQFAGISGPNATFVALYGRLYGSSLGGLVTWRCGFVPVVVGLISLLTVIRHTRAEEESGRRELIGSTVVG